MNLIPILMALFALGGEHLWHAEESLAFFMALVDSSDDSRRYAPLWLFRYYL